MSRPSLFIWPALVSIDPYAFLFFRSACLRERAKLSTCYLTGIFTVDWLRGIVLMAKACGRFMVERVSRNFITGSRAGGEEQEQCHELTMILITID